ncbi:hypothetical protein OL548_15705 [Lysinibacillus sp. MHQ-1]|nr:hypothetical protein OL548_15705 [Lysinibacillus sp. MHQ-1]
MEQGAVISELFRETSLQTANVTAFSYGVAAESLYERNLITFTHKEIEMALKLGHQLQDLGLCIPMYLLKAKNLYTAKSDKFSSCYADPSIRGCH